MLPHVRFATAHTLPLAKLIEGVCLPWRGRDGAEARSHVGAVSAHDCSVVDDFILMRARLQPGGAEALQRLSRDIRQAGEEFLIKELDTPVEVPPAVPLAFQRPHGAMPLDALLDCMRAERDGREPASSLAASKVTPEMGKVAL